MNDRVSPEEYPEVVREFFDNVTWDLNDFGKLLYERIAKVCRETSRMITTVFKCGITLKKVRARRRATERSRRNQQYVKRYKHGRTVRTRCKNKRR